MVIVIKYEVVIIIITIGWSLRYLKRSGMSNDDLRNAFTTYLRPVLEYGSVAIHSLLTQEQSDLIDRQQYRALKLIY